MQIPRFFLTDEGVRLHGAAAQLNASLDLRAGDQISITDPAITNQIRNVLRLRAGAHVILLNNKGLLFECIVQNVGSSAVDCLVENVSEGTGEPPVSVCIALPLLKGERFDWALQKLTEVGVSSVVPIMTTRTIVKFDLSDAKGAQAKLARWQAILKEAAEQSERSTIPHIVLPKKLESFIDSLAAGGTPACSFICAERTQGLLLKDILLESGCGAGDNAATKGGTINLVIGPEGGFTSQEIEYARNRGVKPVSLGPRILRAETAAIISVAQVIWSLEK